MRFQVENRSGRKWYLLLDAMLGDEFDLFLLHPGDSPTHAQVSTLAFAQPLPDYRRRAWSLNLPQGAAVQVYLRATNRDSVLQLPVEFVQADAMLERSSKDYRLLAALYAAALVLALYQFFMALILRDISYFWLAAHVLATVATIHRTNPVFPGLTFLGDSGSYFFTSPLLIMIVTFLLFARLLLRTRDYTPWLDKLFLALVGLGGCMVAGTGAIPGGTTLPLLLGLLVLVTVFVTSLRIALKGSRIAWYFTGMFVFALLAQSLNVLLLIFLPQQWSVFQDIWASASNLFFIVLMSLIQAERVRLEREQYKQVEAAGKAKEEFLAVMSHELRTPMHAITNLGTLLQLTPLDTPQQQYVDRLREASLHMMQLIGNVLDFGKMSQGQFELQSQPFHLGVAVANALNMLEPVGQQKGLSIRLEGNELLEVSVEGDRRYFSQILINLLGNALKYTEQGQVTLRVEARQTKATNAVCLMFAVEDTGRGIAANRLHTLFDPYQQASGKQGTLYEGTGLGLSISQALVGLMGGRLQVESTLGKGSCFHFTLEFKLWEGLLLVPGEQTAISGLQLPAGLQVLLVDDSDLNRFVGRAMLQNLGATVTLAAGGAQALLQLQQYDFDLMLLDISMPSLNGLETVQQLRKQVRNQSIPVLALTAHALPEFQQQALAAGMDGFLVKPVEYFELYQGIMRVVGLSKA